MSELYFDFLPKEIITDVLLYVDHDSFQDLYSLENNQINDILNNVTFWKYMINIHFLEVDNYNIELESGKKFKYYYSKYNNIMNTYKLIQLIKEQFENINQKKNYVNVFKFKKGSRHRNWKLNNYFNELLHESINIVIDNVNIPDIRYILNGLLWGNSTCLRKVNITISVENNYSIRVHIIKKRIIILSGLNIEDFINFIISVLNNN